MIKEEICHTAGTVLEGMTSISALLSAREAGINNRPIHEILFDSAKKEKKAREFGFLAAKCRMLDVPLSLVTAAEIDALASGNTHGGVVALCGERTLPVPTPENLPENGFLCLLEGIEDPYNFGYAVRSLYAAGVDAILVGERNWLSAAGVVARASAGASEALPMLAGDVNTALEAARARGYRVVCAGIRDAVSYLDADLSRPLVLVVGGEKRGISAGILASADAVVRIDYGRSFRGSLSTASAATVLGFEVLRQNK